MLAACASPSSSRPARSTRATTTSATRMPKRFDIGRAATPAEIAAVGHRCVAEWRRSARRKRNAGAGRGGVSRRTARRATANERRRQAAALSAAHRRTEGVVRLRERLQDSAHDRQLLAVRDDAVRLHPARDAAHRARLVDGRPDVRRHGVSAAARRDHSSPARRSTPNRSPRSRCRPITFRRRRSRGSTGGKNVR